MACTAPSKPTFNPGRYTSDELIATLVEAEWHERQNRSIDLKVKNARFRYKALLEELYYHTDRNLYKNQIMRRRFWQGGPDGTG